MSDLLKVDLRGLPETPGVYLFKDATNRVIYIGKAKNLKSRVTSYFGTNLATKTLAMVTDARDLSFIKVNTEFEALLLEAKLVREKQPKYNIQLKDDKSHLYIAITADKYPRVIALRKTDMGEFKLKTVFGPFIEGQSVRKVLRWLRKIIPYSSHFPNKRVCIYKQLGLCDPCPAEIENEQDPKKKEYLKRKYQANIRKIKKLLSGGLTSVKNDLIKEMKDYSKKEMYEEAQKTASQIRALEYITTPQSTPDLYLKDPNLLEDIRENERLGLQKLLSNYFDIANLNRIECFDIAHLAGTNPTASMVTFVNGEADKSYYRHFKVYLKKKGSDVDSMRSILERRIKHFEDWGKPDLIIVDGGKPQVTIAYEALKDYQIPIIGLAKRFETIVIKKNEKFIEVRPKGPALNLLQRIRDEAHRFARRLHHKQVKKSLIGI
ncbi:MAG TPA: GIY-YIG nuclease family protein [Patescibacteria group bacterium]